MRFVTTTITRALTVKLRTVTRTKFKTRIKFVTRQKTRTSVVMSTSIVTSTTVSTSVTTTTLAACAPGAGVAWTPTCSPVLINGMNCIGAFSSSFQL
jgi:hypothetical protein